MNLVLLGVLAYVGAQLAIGLLASRRIASEEDYLLAGRRMGPMRGTLSVFATWFGAETCVGAAGLVAVQGLSGGSADPFGYGLCLLLMAAVFAAPLHRARLTTLADLFRRRFGPGVERWAVLLMVPTSVLWAAAQVRAFGIVLSASSALEVRLTITVAATVAVLYTFRGGLLADTVTDMIQSALLVLGLAVLGVVVVQHLGGWEAAVDAIDPSRLSPVDRRASLWETLEAWSTPIFGSLVAQELVSRVSACRSAPVARGTTFAAAGLYLGVGLVPVALGLLGPGLVPDLVEPERILPEIAEAYLPPLLYVVFAGAIVSAILSTVDTALLVSGSLLAHNLVAPSLGITSDRTRLRLSRAGVVAAGVAAWALALSADGVHELVQSASSFGSAGLFVILCFGLFTRVGGAASALSALAAGLASFVGASWLDAVAPFLISLSAASVAYLATAFLVPGGRGAE